MERNSTLKGLRWEVARERFLESLIVARERFKEEAKAKEGRNDD